jgi:hypothetical protein
MAEKCNRRNTKNVQIIRNGLVRDRAKTRYPHLYEEVTERDKVIGSSWYDLSPEAYEEFRKFCQSAWRREAVK